MSGPAHPFLTEYMGSHVSAARFRHFHTSAVVIDRQERIPRCRVMVYRHTVVSFEQDASYASILATCVRAGPGTMPNCFVACLHSRSPLTGEPLRVILTATQIDPEEPFLCCPVSVERSADELAYVARHAAEDEPGGAAPGEVLARTVAALETSHTFEHWPADLPYYHGVGGPAHASPTPTVGFPYNMLRLGPAAHLGEGQLEVRAACAIPAGTCFAYTGPAAVEKEDRSRGNVAPTADYTYTFALDSRRVVTGQGITRYINHRYRIDPFGSVQFASLAIPVPARGFAGAATTSDHTVVLPFFITTRDIRAGEPITATTYGDAYDAKLEREVFHDGLLRPQSMGPPDCAADFRWSLRRRDIVARAMSDEEQRFFGFAASVFSVCDVSEGTDLVLLSPLVQRGERDYFPQDSERLLIAHVRTIARLDRGVDYTTDREGPDFVAVSLLPATVDAIRAFTPPSQADAAVDGCLWPHNDWKDTSAMQEGGDVKRYRPEQ